MSKLSKAVEPIPKIVVTKCVADTKLLLCCYSYFQLVLCPCVCYDFPVVLTIHERSIRNHCSEEVISFHEEGMTVIRRKIYFFGRIVWIPAELMDIWTEI